MKTPEKILEQHCINFNDGSFHGTSIKNITDAMEEYAKRKAIEFAEWMLLNANSSIVNDDLFWCSSKQKYYSPEEAVNEFLKEKQTK